MMARQTHETHEMEFLSKTEAPLTNRILASLRRCERIEKAGQNADDAPRKSKTYDGEFPRISLFSHLLRDEAEAAQRSGRVERRTLGATGFGPDISQGFANRRA